MKILYLWNHQFFGPPLVRAIPPLASEHGIYIADIKLAGENPNAPPLAERYDALIVQTPPGLTEWMVDLDIPIIIMERVDGAQLRQSRHNVGPSAGVIKGYTFRNREDYNTIPDRAHIQTLHDSVTCDKPIWHDNPPTPQLSAESLAKIHTGYGFGATDHLRPCIETEVDLDADRPIDVHFAGTVSYENSEVEAHRRLALNAARKWPGKSIASAGRNIKGDEYRAGILQSKCVLSPWGWGEASYRDSEAMVLGAVVIKPHSGHVEAWPDIYREWETYIPCKPDFSDAHDWIRHIVNHPGHWNYMRSYARKLVVDAWQPEAIAAHFAPIIKGMLG